MTYHIYYSIFLKKVHLYFYLPFTQNVASGTAFLYTLHLSKMTIALPLLLQNHYYR